MSMNKDNSSTTCGRRLRHLRQISESGQIQAAGFCFDVILHREGNRNQEAIQCSLEHADGEATGRFTPYSKTHSGSVLCGESFTADPDRKIFGFAARSRTSRALTDPNAAGCSCRLLTPRGGPGFLILEGLPGTTLRLLEEMKSLP
jgi:hypothetical protein